MIFAAEIDDTEYLRITAYVGENTTLLCRTSLDVVDVDWKYNDVEYLYLNGYTHHPRFTVDRRGPGQYDLVMPSIQWNESGNYTCWEDSGLGRRHVYIVNITGKTTVAAAATAAIDYSSRL